MSTFKFATRNFLGKIVKSYTVEEKELKADAPTKNRVGHHIMVVDASGSMYGDIGHIKEKIRKVLTLDEYNDSEMLVSLISYSSSGDCIEHFSRVPVGDIVKSKNTKAQREIGSLRSRGMTCMTQAFEVALKLAKASDKDELIAVSLHTDGFFNDPSPTAEFRRVDGLIEEFKKLPNVFVNTIGYRDWCDFAILEKIANALSGKCWQAKDLKTFYDSLYDTSTLLNGQTAPSLCLEKNGKFDYQLFVSSDGKVVGGTGELRINGVKGDATRRVYYFKEEGEKFIEKSKDSELSLGVMLAFAKAQLAEGRVNAAKYAAVSARVANLIETYGKALAGPDLAAFSEALDKLIGSALSGAFIEVTAGYGLKANAIPVPKLLNILAEHRADFLLDVRHFLANYKRRGLKRLSGVWVDGKLMKPAMRTELRDADDFVSVAGFEFNRNNATINMMIAQPCKLIRESDDKEVKELAGKKLALTDYKQYTIVGDGQINVKTLRIRITSKKLYSKLVDAGMIIPGYDPKEAIDINLGALPLVEYGMSFKPNLYVGLADRLAFAHTADKLFSALAKAKSAELSAEQVEELKKHYVTPNLYVSMPTTNPYTDLQKAIAEGEVDVRVSYAVTLGDKAIVNPKDLYSGNEFLRRFYECEGVDDAKKPTLVEWFKPDFKVKRKQLSARTKVGPVDEVMSKVFDAFFGLGDPAIFEVLLGGMTARRLSKVINRKATEDETVEIIDEACKAASERLDTLYREEVTPLVFFVGASGLIPDDFGDVPALTPEQLTQRYPDISIEKSMRDGGAFYDLGNGTILTVVRDSAYYSTEKGVEVAKRLEAAANAA